MNSWLLQGKSEWWVPENRCVLNRIIGSGNSNLLVHPEILTSPHLNASESKEVLEQLSFLSCQRNFCVSVVSPYADLQFEKHPSSHY